MTERDPSQPVEPPKPASAGTDETPTTAWTPPAWTPAQVGSSDEAVPAAAPAEPVRATRGSNARWGIALLISVIVIALGAVAFVLLTGQSAPSSLVGYAPADSVVYGEVRLDLPGDQRQKLGQFLSKFPGFKDQANLPTKVDEVLDRIVLAATSHQHDYTTYIKPWFGGEIGFSASQLPSGATPDMRAVRALVLVSLSDATKARAWLDEVIGDAPKSTADHNGTQLILFGTGTPRFAIGIHGKVMLLGDEASVRAAVDTNGAGSLPKAEQFASALASVRGDSLAYFYVDMKRYFDWIVAAAAETPTGFGFQFDATSRELIPAWAMFRLQARGDSIATEVAFPHVDTKVKTSNRVGEIAGHLPASTILFLDEHDTGEGLLQAVETYRTNPGTAEGFKQIDQVAVLFGGFDKILGWMRDAGFVLTRDGDKVDGGIVFSPKDRAGADRLLTTLRSYAVIGGGQAGLQVTVRDEPYAGTTISVIDFGDWRDIAALGGGPTTTIPFTGHLEVAYAATDQVVVMSLGDSFVKAVLDAKPGSSLADDARYKSLIDRVGAQNAGSVYLDIAAVREWIETLASARDAAGFATYKSDIQPYLLPFDAYIQATTLGGSTDRVVGLVVVK